MKCPGGFATATLEEGQFDLVELHHGQPVVLRNVSGLRCRQCGYELISADSLRRIQLALAGGSAHRDDSRRCLRSCRRPQRRAVAGRAT